MAQLVKDLEVEVVASDVETGQPYNEIRYPLMGIMMVRQQIGSISFLEAGTVR